MITIYYYLIFRTYRVYVDKFKEKDVPLIFTTTFITLLIFFNFQIIQGILKYYDKAQPIPNKYYVLGIMTIIWILNYVIFVRPKRFLDYGFKKDIKGGIIILLYILLTTISVIVIGNLNRQKIFKEQGRNLERVFNTTIIETPFTDVRLHRVTRQEQPVFLIFDSTKTLYHES